MTVDFSGYRTVAALRVVAPLVLFFACTDGSSTTGPAGASGTSAAASEDGGLGNTTGGVGGIGSGNSSTSTAAADGGGMSNDAPASDDLADGQLWWDGETYNVQEQSAGCGVAVSFLVSGSAAALSLTHPPESGTTAVDRLTPAADQCGDGLNYILLTTPDRNWYGLAGEVSADADGSSTRYSVVAVMGTSIDGAGERASLVARFVVDE